MSKTSERKSVRERKSGREDEKVSVHHVCPSQFTFLYLFIALRMGIVFVFYFRFKMETQKE